MWVPPLPERFVQYLALHEFGGSNATEAIAEIGDV
jgi:hypothetical protein